MILQVKSMLVVVMFIFIITTRYLAHICALADIANTVSIPKLVRKASKSLLFPLPSLTPKYFIKKLLVC